jgi:hypothetical protein
MRRIVMWLGWTIPGSLGVLVGWVTKMPSQPIDFKMISAALHGRFDRYRPKKKRRIVPDASFAMTRIKGPTLPLSKGRRLRSSLPHSTKQ